MFTYWGLMVSSLWVHWVAAFARDLFNCYFTVGQVVLQHWNNCFDVFE